VKLNNRLRRLEQKRPDPGCLACRDRRGRIVLVECRRQRDGSVTALQPMPAACAACGQVPEFITEVIHPYDEARPPHDDRVGG
jgi:hypothetical protein